MEVRKIGLFWKLVIILINLFALVFVLGRNHFLLGTALIISRWFLFATGLILFLWLRRRIKNNGLSIIVYLSLILIPAEYLFNEVNQANLQETQSNIELSVLTYNIFFKNKASQQIINRIQSIDPDVLCIQELTPKWAYELNNEIGHKYPFRVLRPLKGTHGIGIYSKYPIKQIGQLANENGLPFAQIATLEIKTKTIGLINVHLASPAIAVENQDRFLYLLGMNYSQRESEMASINEEVKQKLNGMEVIMAGDLNTTEYEPLYRKIRTQWVDVNVESGNSKRYTFPNTSKSKPFLTLDYILLRGQLKGLQSKVIEGGSSDHLGLYSLIGL